MFEEIVHAIAKKMDAEIMEEIIKSTIENKFTSFMNPPDERLKIYQDMQGFIDRESSHTFSKFVEFLYMRNYPSPKSITEYSSHMELLWISIIGHAMKLYVYKSELIYMSHENSISSSSTPVINIGYLNNEEHIRPVLDKFFEDEINNNA